MEGMICRGDHARLLAYLQEIVPGFAENRGDITPHKIPTPSDSILTSLGAA